MSPRRVVDWKIEEKEDGTYDLYLRNRPVLQDRSMTEIDKHLKRHREQGQTVHEIAPDGYKTDHTPRFDRKQRRKGKLPLKAPHRPVRMPFVRF